MGGLAEHIPDLTDAAALLDADRVDDYLHTTRDLAAKYADHPYVHLHYGRALVLTGVNLGEATSELRRAGDLAPTDPLLLTQAASLLFTTGDRRLAQEYVTRAGELVTLSEFPLGAELVNVAGRLAASTGDSARARKLFEAAIEADPDTARYATDLVRFLVDLGDRDEAQTVAREVFLVHPDWQELRSAAEAPRDPRSGDTWTEVVRQVVQGAPGPMRCPVNDDGDLDVSREAVATGEVFSIRCPSCNANISVTVEDERTL
jgi:tetratricopeptide (TPR) repeat protein